MSCEGGSLKVEVFRLFLLLLILLEVKMIIQRQWDAQKYASKVLLAIYQSLLLGTDIQPICINTSTLLPFHFKSSHSVLPGHCSCLIVLFPSHANSYIQHFEYHSCIYTLFFLSYIIAIIACFLNTTKMFIVINKSYFCGHCFPELSASKRDGYSSRNSAESPGSTHFFLIDITSHPSSSLLLKSMFHWCFSKNPALFHNNFLFALSELKNSYSLHQLHK